MSETRESDRLEVGLQSRQQEREIESFLPSPPLTVRSALLGDRPQTLDEASGPPRIYRSEVMHLASLEERGGGDSRRRLAARPENRRGGAADDNPGDLVLNLVDRLTPRVPTHQEASQMSRCRLFFVQCTSVLTGFLFALAVCVYSLSHFSSSQIANAVVRGINASINMIVSRSRGSLVVFDAEEFSPNDSAASDDFVENYNGTEAP